MAPQGAGLAEEAGDNSGLDLPRPPARLRWRNAGEVDFGSEGGGQVGQGAQGGAVRQLARLWGPLACKACRAGAPGWGGVGEGRGHLAPIPALWGEVALPSEEGRPRRPQPAPPPGLASRFGLAGGTQASDPASAHLASLSPETSLLSPGPRNGRQSPSEAVWSRTPGHGKVSGSGRRPSAPQPLSLHPSWNPARLAPSSPTHCPRGEGARRLSRRCRGSGRTWRENVGSSCRGAGSCQWKWGRLQVTDRLPLRRKEAPASQRSLF